MFDSKINWQPGMELTSAVFRNRDKDIEDTLAAGLRTSVISGRVGVIPGYEYYADGAFVGKRFEMTGLKCTAILPSGRIITVDDDLSLEMPKLADGEYFLCVGDSGRLLNFERDSVPYTRTEYELTLCLLDEIDKKDRYPIRHFIVTNGELNVDMEYIAPVLSMSCEPRLVEYLNRLTSIVESLLAHPNMVDVDCKRLMTAFHYRLKYFGIQNSTYAFAAMLGELAFTIDYFFVSGLGKSMDEIPEKVLSLRDDDRRNLKRYDCVPFLKWITEYLGAQSELLDRVVVVDNTIDVDKLKQDIKDVLIEQLREELYGRLLNDIHDKLRDELNTSLMDTLESKLNDLRPELSENLSSSLYSLLYPALYDSAYKALYEALYKEEREEVDTFNPMI